MIDVISARQLHDRVTRGGVLTQAEQAQLDAWYGQQDADENTMLLAATPPASTTLQSLRSEVEASSSRLLTVMQRIQSLAEENDSLRRDIAALKQQLARVAPPRAA